MKFLKGLGIIVGLMFGAGVFALPFAIAHAGVLWGVVHLLIALSLTIFLLFLYAEITYKTDGSHRFTGYVGRILGKKSKLVSFLVILGSYYATLPAYAILGGLFLSNFWKGTFSKEITVAFFVVGGILIFLRLSKVALINFYLTIPLFGFVVYLFFTALPAVDLSNFPLTLNGFSVKGAWFLPYGVWLFSLGAMAAIPETRDIFRGSPLKDFKKVIAVSVLLSALFYCLFIFAIVGVGGLGTSEDALSGIMGALGSKIILIGSAMGFLAVFTSFLALGIDLRDTFRFDYNISKNLAWLLVVVPPMIFYFLGLQNFTLIISLVGAVGGGVGFVFIILMARKMGRTRRFGVLGNLIEIVVLTALLAAVAYEIWHIFF